MRLKPKFQMVATLHEVQASVEAEIKRVGESLIYAAKQLSIAGLTGSQAHAILVVLAANSSYIINAATVDLQDIIVAVNPKTGATSKAEASANKSI